MKPVSSFHRASVSFLHANVHCDHQEEIVLPNGVRPQSPLCRKPASCLQNTLGKAANVFFKDVHNDSERGKPHQSDTKHSSRKWRQHIAALRSAGGLLASAIAGKACAWGRCPFTRSSSPVYFWLQRPTCLKTSKNICLLDSLPDDVRKNCQAFYNYVQLIK